MNRLQSLCNAAIIGARKGETNMKELHTYKSTDATCKVVGLEPGEYLDPTSGYKLEDCRAWVREEEEKMRQEREAIDAAEEEARIRAAEHHDDDAPHESWCDLKPDDDLPF